MGKKMMVRIGLCMGVALSVVAVVAGGLVLLGRLQIAFKEPRQELAVVGRTICNEEIVDEYLSIIRGQQGYGATALQSLVDKVRQRGGPADDATCHFILLHDASLRGDHQNMEKLKSTFLHSMSSRQVVDMFYKLGITPQNVDALVEMGRAEVTENGDSGSGEG